MEHVGDWDLQSIYHMTQKLYEMLQRKVLRFTSDPFERNVCIFGVGALITSYRGTSVYKVQPRCEVFYESSL